MWRKIKNLFKEDPSVATIFMLIFILIILIIFAIVSLVINAWILIEYKDVPVSEIPAWVLWWLS